VIRINYVEKSQLRTDISKTKYSDLDDNNKEKVVAWHISALDAMTMPVLNQTQYFDYFYSWYTGFGNGLSYFSPGTYKETIY